jgi:ADP-ribose pyrophosphatase
MYKHLVETPLSSERIYEGRMINLRRDMVRLPDGNSSSREVVEHPGAVAVVPILDDDSILLVRQFRHPVGKVLLEIPAGKLGPGEEPDLCAARELEEETGYRANKLERRSSLFTGPGFTDEIIHIYVASDLVRSAACPDEDEFIEAERFDADTVRQMVRDGRICDAKTIAGLMLAWGI